MANKYLIGALILAVLSSSIYIYLEGQAKISVGLSSTVFQIWNATGDNSGYWITGGVEYSKVFNGTKLIRFSRAVTFNKNSDNFTNITRTSTYKDILLVDNYQFNGNVRDVEFFPIRETHSVSNASGMIYQYEVQKLPYYGGDLDLLGRSEFIAGQMKVNWQAGNYYAKVFATSTGGKLVVKYRIASDYEIYRIRLSDPLYTETSNTTSPASPATYSTTANYSFAINWTDTNNATSNVTFQLGRPSGTLTNYTQDYAGASLPEDNSLVGHWKLDTVNGTNYTLDSSQYKNDGRMYNFEPNPINNFSSAVFSNGTNFDGVNDYVDVGNRASLNITNAITISTWIYALSGTTQQGIISKRVSASTPLNYQLSIEADGTFTFYPTPSAISTTTTGYTNQWIHLAATYDGATKKIFLNGVEKAAAAQTGAMSTSGAQLLNIGRKVGYPTLVFNGSIDEVRIYNRSLSADEILAQYNAGYGRYIQNFTQTGIGGAGAYNYTWFATNTTGSQNSTQTVGYTINKAVPILTMSNTTNNINTSGLVLYMPFSEGSGANVTEDKSGYGNNGTQHGTNLTGNSTSGWTSSGKYGSGLQFDGVNDYVAAGNASSLNITDGTIIGWIYSPSDLNANNVLASKVKTTSDAGWGLYLRKLNTVPYSVALWLGGTIQIQGATDLRGGWHQLAATKNGNDYVVYVDGNSVGTHTGSYTFTTTNILIFGAFDSSALTAFANGTIDEVRIYNRALSADEIKMQYNSSKYYPYTSNVSASISNSEQTLNFYRYENTSLANPFDNQILGAKQYWYIANASATQNYTKIEALLPFEILKNNTHITLISPPDNHINPDKVELFTYSFQNNTNYTTINNCSLFTNETSWSAKQSDNFTEKTNVSAVGLIINTGNIISGALSDTYAQDGHILSLAEVSGSPGYNYTFNFTDSINTNQNITLYINSSYDGNTAHSRTVGFLNKTSGSCDMQKTISLTSYSMIKTSINASNVSSYIFSDGTVHLCGIHASSGNPTHIWNIDYLALEKTSTASGGEHTFTQTFSADGTYLWNVKCTDADGYSAFAVANRTLIIDSTPPTPVTLLTPTNGDHTNTNQTAFDWTDATDVAGVDKYNLQIANASNFSENYMVRNITGISASTYTLTLSEALSDGIYYWRVRANDTIGNGYGNWSANGNFTVIIDTVFPDWIIGNYPKFDNTTSVSNSITWDAKVYDTNLFRILLNMTNASGKEVYSNYTADWNSSWFNFSHTTSLLTFPAGNYTIELSATDDHTDTTTDLKKSKKGESIAVFNSTSSNTEISAYFVEKDDKPAAIPADFKFNVSELNWRGFYKFTFNFTVNKPETKLLLNITSSKPLIYREKSSYKGHFVWDKYYLDFNDVPNDFNLSVKKINSTFYQIRISGKTAEWAGNQKIFIDPVAGGLNTRTEYYNISLVPFPQIWMNGSLANSSYYIDQVWNITVSCGVSAQAGLYLNATGFGNNFSSGAAPHSNISRANVYHTDTNYNITGVCFGTSQAQNSSFINVEPGIDFYLNATLTFNPNTATQYNVEPYLQSASKPAVCVNNTRAGTQMNISFYTLVNYTTLYNTTLFASSTYSAASSQKIGLEKNESWLFNNTPANSPKCLYLWANFSKGLPGLWSPFIYADSRIS